MGEPGGRRYDLPRRYPVTRRDAPADRSQPVDATRENPRLAPPAAPPPAPPPGRPPPGPPPGPSFRRPPLWRRLSTTAVLSLVLVLLVVAAAAVVVIVRFTGGTSGNPSAEQPAATPGRDAPASTSAPASSANASAVPSAILSTVPSTSDTAPASPTAQSEQICGQLSAIRDVRSLISPADIHPGMPPEYVVPRRGRNTSVCLARFLGTSGHVAGTSAFVAVYDDLSLPAYAAQLRAAGWHALVRRTPTTFADPVTTSVTLVQRGDSLVMIVDRSS